MENKRTCLYDKHVALGALISPFGGFDMQLQMKIPQSPAQNVWIMSEEKIPEHYPRYL